MPRAIGPRCRGLTSEQKAKAKACTSAEELVALAKEEGYELTDSELEAVAGGSWDKCTCNTRDYDGLMVH